MVLREDKTNSMEKLFVYGTLLEPAIQLQLFGRIISPLCTAVLKGWTKKTDKEYPYLIPDDNALTIGSIIELSAAELAIADQWEEVPREYLRVKLPVTLPTGNEINVWVYVCATNRL
ncbi:MAG: gamma-glutamylcyclotransferase [Bacteroidetes bacterium]|nr:MAG: gamma-glutamylcyclotransferase [Bacteroidota bacterium]